MFSIHLVHMILTEPKPCGSTHLVAIVYGGSNLPEDSSRVGLAERLPVADVVVQLPARGYLHHQHHLLFVLKHCKMKKFVSLFTQ